MRRAAKSASSGVGAPAPTAADEEELAQAALTGGRIDRRTGEKVGGAKSAAVASHDSSGTVTPPQPPPPQRTAGTGAATTSTTAPAQQQPMQAPPRKFYGWGGASQKGEGAPAAVSGSGAAGSTSIGAAGK